MASQPITEKIVNTPSVTVDAQLNWVDVFMTGESGKVYHKWYRPPAGDQPGGWRGPEVITDAL